MNNEICLICGENKDDNGLTICSMCNEQNINTFEAGVRYALDYLSSLYDGLDETDIWKEYKENN